MPLRRRCCGGHRRGAALAGLVTGGLGVVAVTWVATLRFSWLWDLEDFSGGSTLLGDGHGFEETWFEETGRVLEGSGEGELMLGDPTPRVRRGSHGAGGPPATRTW